MARTVYQTTLRGLRQLTPTLRELVIQIDGGLKMPFQAGQFVMLQVPVAGQEKPAQRAYSIASSSASDTEFTLMFKHVPGGLASEYVAQLKGGETLSFTGPWGKCVFKHPAPPQVFFVCTGSGVSQHYSFLTSEAQKYPNTRFEMLIGVSAESEMFYAQELKALQEKFPNFGYTWCLSRPSETWTGKKGRVTQFIQEYQLSPETSHVYLCGSDAMIKDMKSLLTEKYGLTKDQMIIENFG